MHVKKLTNNFELEDICIVEDNKGGIINLYQRKIPWRWQINL